MAHDGAPRGGGPITDINVTPLVDVTLVLLIVFMVTAKLIVDRRSLELDLPKATTGARTQEILAVTLFADGRTELDGRSLPNDDEIALGAGRARGDAPGLRAVIQAETQVPHGRVIHVLDLLRRTGISKVSFAVVPETAPGVPER